MKFWAAFASLNIALVAIAVAPQLTAAQALDIALRSQLRQSSVPVLLPERLPKDAGSTHSLAVISAGINGYYVGYSPIRHCAGALSCSHVHVAGFPRRGRFDERKRSDRRVRLADGRPAFYRAVNCSGASCTEASLTFERGNAVYEIDANLVKNNLDLLLRLAMNLRPVH